MAATIALIAHDRRKNDLVDFARRHEPVLARYQLIATGTTAQCLQSQTGLQIEPMLPGPLGGDAQIAAQIAERWVVAVIFLVDATSAQAHEPTYEPLLRLCNLHSVPFATNLATAEAIISSLAKTQVAHLIFNPVAGQGDSEQELALIQELLEPHLHLQVHITTPTVGPAQLTKKAIAAEPDLIIASGGDGTVSAVAGTLINTAIPLGVIPRGTANAFAVALGISSAITPIRSACEVILAGKIRVVDVAYCNGKPMILLAGVGYEAEMAAKADRKLKNKWGPLAYLMAGWQQLSEQKLFATRIEFEDGVQHLRANAITIANAAPTTSVLAHGTGQVIVDDGLLDVTITTAETRLQTILSILSLLKAGLANTATQNQNVVTFTARRLKVTTDPAQKVVIDGEIVGTTPVEVECIPSGLTVLAPERA